MWMGLTLLQCVARIFLNYHYGKERNQMKLEMRIQNGKKYCHSSVRLFLTPVLTCSCSATVTSTKNMYNTKKIRTSKHEVFLPPPNQIHTRNWYPFPSWNPHSFHLYSGGVSLFTTPAMSSSGSFCTFIVHGPWTGSKTVQIWLKIE